MKQPTRYTINGTSALVPESASANNPDLDLQLYHKAGTTRNPITETKSAARTNRRDTCLAILIGTLIAFVTLVL